MRGNATVLLVGQITEPGKDKYGDPIADPTPADDVVLEECVVAPRSSDETADPRTPSVITGLTVYVPGEQGLGLQPSDQLRVDGVLYDIEGEPGVWTSPYTQVVKGVEVALTKWVKS